MAEKELGYVELVWTCKQCGTKNTGRQKTCTNCGATRAADVQLELPAEQTLITDAEVLKETGHGPDIHCPYCNAPNRGDAEVCVQCGGKLAGGQVRPQGEVLGAFQSGPAAQVHCPACNSLNHPDAPRCQNCGAALPGASSTEAAPAGKVPARPNTTVLVIMALVGAVICVGLGVMLAQGLSRGTRTSELNAVVQNVSWQRSLQVLEVQPVEREGWKDLIPSGASLGQCRDEVRRVQAEPIAGAEEVCGTPYTVDQGNGVAKVVQKCEYQVYEPYCSYTVNEWVVTDELQLQGSDLDPQWPAFTASDQQREGQRSERYQVTFSAGNESYTYTTSDPQEYSQFTPGSQWLLEVNGFGAVTGLQPSR